ncbi:helix-turn-helix domain-containing protein, partial [Francisellaceae bacterium]|nr:helix-turn-helix domain-containing protein [Francisellaceae bacterium]
MCQRLELIEKMLQPGANISEICEASNISRKTAYKWLSRYRSDGLAGLKDKSKIPKFQPKKSPQMLDKVIVK